MVKTPEGMDVEYFLKQFGDDPEFNEPYIYILRQDPQIPSPPYFRAGAAGTALFATADPAYLSSDSSRIGLAGRVTMYIGHIRPNRVLLYAALRIKKAVVALPHHRLGGEGENQYNIDKGNQSAVLAAESVMHHFMDKDANINRFPEHPDSELFRPKNGVEELIKNMRRVRGMNMVLFDKKSYREDTTYKGGDAIQPIIIKDVQKRTLPERKNKETAIVVRLSSEGIAQLRSGNAFAYARLMNLMREAYKDQGGTLTTPIKIDLNTNKKDDEKEPERTTIVPLRRKQINALTNKEIEPAARAEAVADLVTALPRIPRVTRQQARITQAPRRSARLAALN